MGQTVTVTVVLTDLLADNGVVHVIDNVIEGIFDFEDDIKDICDDPDSPFFDPMNVLCEFDLFDLTLTPTQSGFDDFCDPDLPNFDPLFPGCRTCSDDCGDVPGLVCNNDGLENEAYCCEVYGPL